MYIVSDTSSSPIETLTYRRITSVNPRSILILTPRC